MKALLLALLALTAYGQSQNQFYPYIATTGNTSITAAYAVTLQQPATNSRQVSFPIANTGGAPPVGLSIYCSAACVATLSRTCTTPATTTAGTVTGINPTTPVPNVQFFTASNASGCTTLKVINVAAGQEYPVDMSAILMGAGNANTNITVSIASVTATVNISFFPLEQH